MLGDVLAVRLFQFGQYVCLVRVRLVVWIDRETRDEDVIARSARQVFCGLADDARDIARWIDDDIPLSVAELFDLAVPVAVDVLTFGEEMRIGPAAMKEGDHIAAGKSRFDVVPAKELGAAKDEKLHEKELKSRLMSL